MFQVDLVCLSLVRLLVKRFFSKWDRSRDFLTKADNVSFDIESSDDKDSFVVVVVDSLAVCDRVFRVVLGICVFDLGGFDVGGFDFVSFDIEDLAIGGGINWDSSGTSESINRGLVFGGIILLVSPSLSDGHLFEAGINTSSSSTSSKVESIKV